MFKMYCFFLPFVGPELWWLSIGSLDMNAGFSLSTEMFCVVPLTLMLYTLSDNLLIISCGPVYGFLTWSDRMKT